MRSNKTPSNPTPADRGVNKPRRIVAVWAVGFRPSGPKTVSEALRRTSTDTREQGTR